MLRIRAILILIICILQTGLFAQNISIEDIVQNLNELHEDYPFEKVYLHTDRDIYSAGQTLWFKSYVVDASTNIPLDLSRVLYVDLLDENEKAIITKKIFIDRGFGAGNIELPEDLPSGNIILRAYTRYMLNFPSDYLFRKKLSVIDLKEIVEPEPSQGLIDVQFFPEGGNMVAGISTVLGIKAINQEGYGVEVQGVIKDESNQVITRFSTNSIGIGKTEFLPFDKRYYYQLDGIESGALPKVYPEGFTLKVRQVAGQLYIESGNNMKVPMNNYSVLIHSGGIPEAYFQGSPSQSKISGKLNLESLRMGIATVTLFDPAGKPLCERLFFVEKSTPPRINFELSKSQQSRRSPVQVSAGLITSDSAQVSISVVRPEYLNQRGTNIFSYLLLESDLRGYLEDVGRYFDEENPHRETELDNLLMTQGWRRFDWTSIIQNIDPELISLPEQGLSLKGRVTNFYNDKKPVVSTLALSFLENLNEGKTTTTDEEGYFEFKNLQFIDTVGAVVQGSEIRKGDKKRKEGKKDVIKIHLYPDETAPVYAQDASLLSRSSSTSEEFKKNVELLAKIDSSFFVDESTIVLDEIKIRATRPQWKDSPFNRGQLYRNPRSRLVVDSLPPVNRNVIDLLRRMPGVRVSGIPPNYSISVRNTISITLDTTPGILIDGIPVDVPYLVNLDISNVEFIDLISTNQAALYGTLGAGGIIAVYTRRGNGATSQKELNRIEMGISGKELIGYSMPEEFYAPRYDVKKEEHIRPDYRSVLHWEPSVYLKSGQTTEFDFYTSDEVAEYNVVVQGLTYDGKLIYLVEPLVVRN